MLVHTLSLITDHNEGLRLFWMVEYLHDGPLYHLFRLVMVVIWTIGTPEVFPSVMGAELVLRSIKFFVDDSAVLTHAAMHLGVHPAGWYYDRALSFNLFVL